MTSTHPPSTVTSLAAAARMVGVTPATVRTWITKGWLATGPWTPQQLTQSAERSRQRAGRGSHAPHGTPSRWRTGCHCAPCAQAHLSDLALRRAHRRTSEWEPRQKHFLAALAAGLSLREAMAAVDVTVQAVTAHRRRDANFARLLDEALTAGRNPDIDHGTHAGWRRGCRCPDCRTHHESTRSASIAP